MKRSLTILVFVCFAKANIAQLYQPFPVDGAMWREWAYAVDPSYNDSWNYQYFTAGDTIISGETYHKVLKTGTFTHLGWTNYSYSYSDLYVGCYREDTARHILFCSNGDTTEQLLYDFNLNIGDTLDQQYNSPIGEMNWVSAIDSILVGGQYHKQYHISGDTTSATRNSDFVQIIEGVGSTFGLIGYLRPVFESESHLSCYTHNGITEYPDDGTTTSCDPIIIGVSEIARENQLLIYPNPTKGEIHLQPPFLYSTEIIIHDVFGKTIYQTAISGKESTINLSTFSKGIYFLKSSSGNKSSSTQKIILQ